MQNPKTRVRKSIQDFSRGLSFPLTQFLRLLQPQIMRNSIRRETKVEQVLSFIGFVVTWSIKAAVNMLTTIPYDQDTVSLTFIMGSQWEFCMCHRDKEGNHNKYIFMSGGERMIFSPSRFPYELIFTFNNNAWFQVIGKLIRDCLIFSMVSRLQERNMLKVFCSICGADEDVICQWVIRKQVKVFEYILSFHQTY